MSTYDLVVIGTGTAAQVASARVRKAGWSVAIIDRSAAIPTDFQVRFLEYRWTVNHRKWGYAR
jgi:choline dehydrogenase-like flavoprotein